jgi:hypothetical protein
VFQAAEQLMNLMVSLTYDVGVDGADYRQARSTLLGDQSASKLVPEFIRTARDPAAFHALVLGRQLADFATSERELYIRDAFEPLLSALEQFVTAPIDGLVAEASAALNAAAAEATWTKALARRQADPEGAITVARTLLESVCKTILDDLGATYGRGDDLPKLYHEVSTELNLAPSLHVEQQFKQILGGVTSVVQGLGSLRNQQSDAHGQGRKRYRPSARHAALAVNLAGSTAVFLMQTWEARQQEVGRWRSHPATVAGRPDRTER